MYSSQFSPKSSQQTPDISPQRVRYVAPFQSFCENFHSLINPCWSLHCSCCGIQSCVMNEWMNIYFTEVFRLVHHFTCIYTSSWISHTSDSHKSFNIDIYISFVLPAIRASFIQGLYFWFRVFKVIIPVYQYITKFFLRFSTLATGTLRSWSARHQFDACASRWCPTDANPSVPMVRAISTFSFVLKEEMKTSVGICCTIL